MKILIVHNEYMLKSGEETAVNNEVAALRHAGHEVLTYFVSNTEVNNIFRKISAGLSTIYSFKHKRRISKILANQAPDIVHVHNFFPLISPSVFYACKDANIACVHTLHNYRIVCPSTTLFHDKKIYKEGINRNYLKVILDRVYRHSFVATTLLTMSIIFHKLINTWTRVDALIALSDFQKNIFDQQVSANVEVLPHFTSAPPANLNLIKPFSQLPKHFHIYAGRLEYEKGIVTLVESWPSDENLIIVGSGTEENVLNRLIKQRTNIFLLGQKSKEDVLRLMSKAQSCVVPSVVHETFGLAIIESISVGTPVIANNLEPFKSLITEGETGFLFDLSSPRSLDIALKKIVKTNTSLRRGCIDHYRIHYTEAVGVARLEKLFSELIKH
ncbi:MAG: glycosyltransferase involved in cell wall biosynthesis [Arenicella sp.]|jgi:glycosyltransferase involved in cell wall biosynthesis